MYAMNCPASEYAISKIMQARKRTSRVLYILSISLLQNIANTLFDTTGEIKGQLLYYIRFEMILNSRLFSQICGQRECTSLRDCLSLPSNNTLKILIRHLLNKIKSERSLYRCFQFQLKVPTQSKYINKL